MTTAPDAARENARRPDGKFGDQQRDEASVGPGGVDLLASPTAPSVPGPRLDTDEHWSIAQGADRWHAGGCGAFAIAMQQMWPHLKLACEMYDDHGEELVAHAWAYDPATNTRFDIFGAQGWTPTEQPDYDPDSHRVALDLTPQQVRDSFTSARDCSEDEVYDAMHVAAEMFRTDYEPYDDDDDAREHLYWR